MIEPPEPSSSSSRDARRASYKNIRSRQGRDQSSGEYNPAALKQFITMLRTASFAASRAEHGYQSSYAVARGLLKLESSRAAPHKNCPAEKPGKLEEVSSKES